MSTINYRGSIAELRDQMHVSGRQTQDLDRVLGSIDAPVWSYSLNVTLLKNINRAVEKVEEKSKLDFNQLLAEIEES